MEGTVVAFCASRNLSASAAMASSSSYLVKSVMQERTLAGRRFSQRARSMSMGLDLPKAVGAGEQGHEVQPGQLKGVDLLKVVLKFPLYVLHVALG